MYVGVHIQHKSKSFPCGNYFAMVACTTLQFQGTRLQEKALRNRFTKKSSFDKLLRRRSIARSYFSMPNLNVFSAAFNERSPASHLRVLLKRPPAPDLSELELKLGIIDEHGNLKNPLRPAEHGLVWVSCCETCSIDESFSFICWCLIGRPVAYLLF